jgi:transcriptional regulator with XRE-family HTH domain
MFCTFHHNLRHTRLLRHYSQEEMSSRLHICRQAYNNYELGKRTPALEIFVELTHILDVPADYLLYGEKSALRTPVDSRLTREFYNLSPHHQRIILEYISQNQK